MHATEEFCHNRLLIVLCRDRLLKVFYHDREFFFATKITQPHVATEILCRDRARVRAAEVHNDRAPLEYGKVLCRAHDGRDSLHAFVHTTNSTQCMVLCTV